jgi:IS605 OrfB family transposase
MQQDVRDRLKTIDDEIADAQNRGADESELWDRRRRFVKHTLHHIANRIVNKAERHNALIAFEDLENIKGATGSSNLDRGLKRSQYGRLYDYVEYKAEERGLRLVEVAPQYTSQTCPCGVTDPDSRLSRDTFQCMACGYEEHADLNAAHMIGLRGLEYITGGGHESFGHFVSQLDLR